MDRGGGGGPFNTGGGPFSTAKSGSGGTFLGGSIFNLTPAITGDRPVSASASISEHRFSHLGGLAGRQLGRWADRPAGGRAGGQATGGIAHAACSPVSAG